MNLFTTIKFINRKPLGLTKHLEKLINSYQQLGLQFPLIPLDELDSFLEKSPLESGRLNISTEPGKKATFKLKPYTKNRPQRISLKTYSSPFYEPYAFAKKQDFSKRLELLEKAKGFDDWIFYDESGHILETCIANLFWIREKTLGLPDLSLPYYHGTTLDCVCEAAIEMGYQIAYEKLSLEDLFHQRHLFICNSMKGIVGVDLMNEYAFDVDKDLVEALNQRVDEMLSLDSL